VACAKAEKLVGGDSASGMLRWKRETKLYDRKLLQVGMSANLLLGKGARARGGGGGG